MQLPASVNDDWAVLCHASRLLFYLAKRFNATSLVDTDIAARGMGDH
jgi:hypothetical protein